MRIVINAFKELVLCLVKALRTQLLLMVRKPKAKVKKHQILGGIKVSSQQLSKWGKTGGRPKKWTSEAERKRAERLKKKQERFGKEAQLRDYRVSEKRVEFKSSLEMICSKCGAESIGGPQHLGGSCWRFFCSGKMVIKKMTKKPECQHNWTIISDFASYGYSQCKKCEKMK